MLSFCTPLVLLIVSGIFWALCNGSDGYHYCGDSSSPAQAAKAGMIIGGSLMAFVCVIGAIAISLLIIDMEQQQKNKFNREPCCCCAYCVV
jgi:hypothetical protein